ncbi:MAG: preprotein translocase subunit SecG [Candidatus Omnitrophica bacterium]|jgi:preprotein translocase subunit SecG|nr:preprotein translocase subunit SecG [Candidatus Omnitrophota bacterium]MDD5660390.1 preprotein translocase subunit SecG [Candidatus Omnitrophota bacterium]
MMTLLIVVHVIACVILIILVLIQRGRGAGLVESFAGVESMFGTKTSAFLTRTTTIMSVVFFITCLGLAVMSVKQSKSLMRDSRLSTKKAAAAASQPEPAQAINPETVKANVQEAPAAVNPPAETVKPDAAKTK